MSKKLSEYEKKKRRDNNNYFKNGKPKKSSMLCMNKKYIKELVNINGHYDVRWACGGNRCPLYATVCDNRGKDWC